MTILNDEEVNKLKIDMNLTSVKQLPEIGVLILITSDVSSSGNVCKITRKSVTSLENDYYRICV